MTLASGQALDFDLGAHEADDNMAALASGQRLAIAGVLGYFVGAAFQTRGFFVFALLLLASFVCLCIGAVRITRALGYSLPARVLVVLGLLAPLLNLITLLLVSNRATSALRVNGWQVGLLGASGGRGFWFKAVCVGLVLLAVGAALDYKWKGVRFEAASSVSGLAADFNRSVGAPRMVSPGVRIEGADAHGGDFRVRMRLLEFTGNALRPEQRIQMREVAAQAICKLPAAIRSAFDKHKARLMYQIENSRGDSIAQILVTLDSCQ
ncbi:hypothetical protein [Denitromonas halophila]|uniref:Uncharacterized protein n=1 Tax=Denitromonas halophila TaxID=1629404 RepID=A0A557QW76_9RHOO|nr:hypothetical protein [Denitromonas halophila]TVO57164.1 hypothetical protein FHP91_09720 [Denitromonas halophila]